MKKKLSLILALILVLASLFNAAAVFADDEEKTFIDFYWSCTGVDYNGMSCKLDTEGFVAFYAQDEYPQFLEDAIYEFVLTDESGNALDLAEDNCWYLEKGSYTLTWTNIDEIKEMLKSWELYDKCDFSFPEEDSISVYVDGEKTKVSFWICPSSSVTVDPETGYIFDPSTLWVMQLDGVSDYDDFVEFYFLFNDLYSFDVMDKTGHILTGEELTKPMKEGSYKLTWNNVDELKELVENSDAEIFERYTVEFPEEAFTTIFTVNFEGTAQPYESMGFFGSYGTMEGNSLPKAEDLIWFSDIDFESKEDYPQCLENVVIEYYDENGRKLESSETVGGMAAGTYIARWVNYDEFLAMDEENGWGIQQNYQCDVYFGDECPECVCEFYPAEDNQIASVFGNGNLTIVLGFFSAICLAVIIALVIKIQKMKEGSAKQ